MLSDLISPEGVEALKFKNSGTGNANRLKRIAKKHQVQAPRQPGQKWNGLVFMVLNTPFPVANRWYVLQMVHDESRAEQNSYQRCWNLVLGNIDAAEGCWTLQASGDGQQTLARYHDSVDPGGKVPAWISKTAATRSVPDMFNSLEKETARVMRLAARP